MFILLYSGKNEVRNIKRNVRVEIWREISNLFSEVSKIEYFVKISSHLNSEYTVRLEIKRGFRKSPRFIFLMHALMRKLRKLISTSIVFLVFCVFLEKVVPMP